MADQSDAVLAYWSEHRQQFRQSEDQRAVLTNYVLVIVIVSALTGLAVQQKLTSETLPLAILVMVVGLYGALTVAKYHERADYHLSQARALTKVLVQRQALPGDESGLDEHRRLHNAKYPRLHRLRLHWLWTGLHVTIALLGLVLAVVIILK